MLPNGKVESVDLLLASLHYGEKKEDTTILEQLSAIFGVPAGTDLRAHLIASVDFSKLFAELVKLVEPFAQMMKEIYEFLSEQQNTANASQRLVVGESIQDEITFDLQVFPEVYQSVIQQIEEYLQVYDLEKMRNRDISPLFYTECLLSFGHCTQPQYEKKNACQECDLAFRARIEKVFQQLREMVDVIPAEMKIDEPFSLPCAYFEQAYEHFRSGTSITGDCLGYRHWEEIFDILEQRIALVSVKQLGHRDVEVLLHFFELPFWQERDRLYEVWVLIHFIDLLVGEGFKIELNREQEPDSQKWQWRLVYGQATEPVAWIREQGLEVEIWFQRKVIQGLKTFPASPVSPDILFYLRRNANNAVPLALIESKEREKYERDEIQKLASYYKMQIGAAYNLYCNYLEYAQAIPLKSFDGIYFCEQFRPGGAKVKRVDREFTYFIRQKLTMPQKLKTSSAIQLKLFTS